MDEITAANVRPTWFHAALEECQIFVGRIVTKRSAPSRRTVRRFLDRLPQPAGAAESLALRWLLTELAIHLVAEIHVRSRRLCGQSCCVAKLTPLLSTSADRLRDPRPAFGAFIDTLVPAASTSTSERLAERVKHLVDSRYGEKTTIVDLARVAGRSPRSVTTSFRRAFGISLHEYLTRVRVREAVRLLLESDHKIEAIAFMVGYRSKKNLYHGFRRLLGLTPDHVRRHPYSASLSLLTPAGRHRTLRKLPSR